MDPALEKLQIYLYKRTGQQKPMDENLTWREFGAAVLCCPIFEGISKKCMERAKRDLKSGEVETIDGLQQSSYYNPPIWHGSGDSRYAALRSLVVAKDVPGFVEDMVVELRIYSNKRRNKWPHEAALMDDPSHAKFDPLALDKSMLAMLQQMSHEKGRAKREQEQAERLRVPPSIEF